MVLRVLEWWLCDLFSPNKAKKVCKTTAVQCYKCFCLFSLLVLLARVKWLENNKNKKKLSCLLRRTAVKICTTYFTSKISLEALWTRHLLTFKIWVAKQNWCWSSPNCWPPLPYLKIKLPSSQPVLQYYLVGSSFATPMFVLCHD